MARGFVFLIFFTAFAAFSFPAASRFSISVLDNSIANKWVAEVAAQPAGERSLASSATLQTASTKLPVHVSAKPSAALITKSAAMDANFFMTAASSCGWRLIQD